MRLTVTALLILAFAFSAFAQAPSVQLKIKEKSGFLGMGGPRIVKLELANEHRRPIDAENVNEGSNYFFLCTPVGDWKIDPDFVKDELSKLIVYQNEQKLMIAWKGPIVPDAATTSILVGFPKTLKLNELFLFQIKVDELQYEAEFSVPQEYWPGYLFITNALKRGDDYFTAKRFTDAINAYEKVIGNSDLQIFPQYLDVKGKRTRSYEGLFSERWNTFQGLLTNEQMDLKDRIIQIDGSKPYFQYFIDSLPRPIWNIGSLDPTVSPILERCRTAISVSNTVRDSLQRVLDDRNTRWIIEGSAAGKDGLKYQTMIEILAYGFSGMNFTDTSASELKLRVSEEMLNRLAKQNISESYSTFLRICNERFQTHLPIFPIDFLPNLRKDTAAFALPYYSMLKAVNDYFYSNFASAREEIFRIFRTNYEPELNARFDNMRVLIGLREQNVPPEAMKMIEEADQLDSKGDRSAALDKYRQATIIAPNFAYGFYALGKYFVRSGEPIRAITFYQKAYQIDTLYLNAYRESYNLYIKQGNFKPMIEVLTLALQYGNDYWETNYNLGVSYLGDNDPARSIMHFEKALGWNPKSYKTNIQLGLAHQTVKNFQKAREYFNKAIDLDPTRQEAVDYLGKLNELQRNAR